MNPSVQNFAGQDLRSRNFRNQNLKGANFSHCDLRGTDFRGAQLQGANFTGARCGRRVWWLLPVLLLAVLLGGVQGFFTALNGVVAAFLDRELAKSGLIVSGWFGMPVLLAYYLGLGWMLFRSRSLNTVLIPMGLFVAVAVAVAVIGAVSKPGAVAGTLVIAGAVAVVVAGAGAGAEAAVAAAVAAAAAAAVAPSLPAAGQQVMYVAVGSAFLLQCFVIWLNGREHLPLRGLRLWRLRWGRMGGTSFRRANLSGADFSQARLRYANFDGALIEGVIWQGAQEVKWAYMPQTPLATPETRALLVSGRALSRDLRKTDWSGCNLRQADLRDCDLSFAVFIKADLSGADLTGACLAAWSVDGSTRLEQAHADYVFLGEGFTERQPPQGNFAPGEFARLFQAVADTLDFVVHERYELAALHAALARLREVGRAALEIASVEVRQNSTVVKVSAPPEVDREAIHAELRQRFEAEKQGMLARLQSMEKHNLLLGDLLRDAINRPLQITAQGGHVDQSRHQTISNATLTGVVLNQGELSGQVANNIQQLPAAEKPELSAALQQLLAALQATPHLPEDDKTEALGHLERVSAEMAKPEPKPSRIKAALASIKSLSEGAKDAGDLLARVTALSHTIAGFFPS